MACISHTLSYPTPKCFAMYAMGAGICRWPKRSRLCPGDMQVGDAHLHFPVPTYDA